MSTQLLQLPSAWVCCTVYVVGRDVLVAAERVFAPIQQLTVLLTLSPIECGVPWEQRCRGPAVDEPLWCVPVGG